MIKEAISKVVSKRDLTEGEMEEVMREITTRSASAEQTATFVTALRMKGETPEEITGAARVMKDKVISIHIEEDAVSLDREEITVERETVLRTTRGLAEGTSIFNVSTATALIAAGGGIKIAKCGRKSFAPFCGWADVIEALGINLDMTATQLQRCFQEVGLCFLYEPLTRYGLGHLTDIRRKIGIRTIFNLLDPLINPAGATIQVLGVYEPRLTEIMAAVLQSLGIERAIVAHGEETLDEMSIGGKTRITELKNGQIKSYSITPEEVGMRRRGLDEIRGGTAKQNAEIILEILKGGQGATRDIAVLNGAAVFMITGKAKDWSEGVKLASQSIDSGEAFHRLEKLVKFTNEERRYLRNPYETEINL